MNEELKAIECLLEALQDDLIDPEAFAAEFRKNQQRHGVALLPQSLTAAFLRRSVENSADKILGGAAQLLHDAQDVFVSEARRWIEADLVPSWAGTLDAEQCKAARRRLGTRELVPFLQSQTDS